MPGRRGSRALEHPHSLGFRKRLSPTYNRYPMLTILLILRLGLSAVFWLAGLSKLADLPGARQSLADFGLPKALAGLGAILLPLLELAVAVCLLPAHLAWYGAAGALALLVTFLLGIGVTLARGRKPDCHCFGQLHSKPISAGLMARNAGLALVPCFLLYQGPHQPAFSSRLAGLTPTTTLLLVIGLVFLGLFALQGFLIMQLTHQSGRVMLRLEAVEKQLGIKPESTGNAPAIPEGLPAGDPAPAFTLESADGAPVPLADLWSGDKPAILVFTKSECTPCSALMPEIAQWQRDYSPHFRLAVIAGGEPVQSIAKAKEHNLNTLLLDESGQVFTAYRAVVTPAAVMVQSGGAIGSSMMFGSAAVRTLFAAVVNSALASQVALAVREGDTAPPLIYPDLEGRMVSLAELPGSPTAVLFWNPACPFCQQMLPDVKQWEKRASKKGTSLLVISTGSVEDNRKLGLRSSIVLDLNFSAGKAFGATGTPSGLRLDRDGRMISKLASGRQEILDTVFKR
jgi:peroxiredoxin